MSGLAQLLSARGANVAGSDIASTHVTDALAAGNLPIIFERDSRDHPLALPEECDLVIASAAIAPDHPLLLDAQTRGVTTMTYAEALGACMVSATGVALAGTHGKSTTCAMLAHVLTTAHLDPTVIVGATSPHLPQTSSNSTGPARGSGFRLGAPAIPAGPLADAPGLLVAEACEYNRSFHNLRPRIASISVVEADHLDVYGAVDAVIEAFHEFARLLPPQSQSGKLLIGHDSAHRREVTAGLECAVETVGFAPSADWRVEYDTDARLVSLTTPDERALSWTLTLPGEHNALNSAFAASLALSLGAEPEPVSHALSTFQGVDRRTQKLGMRDGVTVYDDYGHHPTEIEATLRALRQFEKPESRDGRLICVFQPHQHSRTRFLLEEFAQSFSQADIVIVPHIYFVRDSEIEKTKVSAADLVDRLRSRSVRAMHLYPFEAIVEQLETICRPGDLLVVMGAGPVWKVAYEYLHLKAPDA